MKTLQLMALAMFLAIAGTGIVEAKTKAKKESNHPCAKSQHYNKKTKKCETNKRPAKTAAVVCAAAGVPITIYTLTNTLDDMLYTISGTIPSGSTLNLPAGVTTISASDSTGMTTSATPVTASTSYDISTDDNGDYIIITEGSEVGSDSLDA